MRMAPNMTIPELMYGSWRYNAYGCLADDSSHLHAHAAEAAIPNTNLGAIPIRNLVVSIVCLFLLIMIGLVTIRLPGMLIWRQWSSAFLWVIGGLVGIGLLMTGFTRKLINPDGRKVYETYRD